MELVRNFLKNKGLKSVLSELDAVSKNDPIEGSISGEMRESEERKERKRERIEK